MFNAPLKIYKKPWRNILKECSLVHLQIHQILMVFMIFHNLCVPVSRIHAFIFVLIYNEIEVRSRCFITLIIFFFKSPLENAFRLFTWLLLCAKPFCFVVHSLSSDLSFGVSGPHKSRLFFFGMSFLSQPRDYTQKNSAFVSCVKPPRVSTPHKTCNL